MLRRGFWFHRASLMSVPGNYRGGKKTRRGGILVCLGGRGGEYGAIVFLLLMYNLFFFSSLQCTRRINAWPLPPPVCVCPHYYFFPNVLRTRRTRPSSLCTCACFATGCLLRAPLLRRNYSGSLLREIINGSTHRLMWVGASDDNAPLCSRMAPPVPTEQACAWQRLC